MKEIRLYIDGLVNCVFVFCMYVYIYIYIYIQTNTYITITYIIHMYYIHNNT